MSAVSALSSPWESPGFLLWHATLRWQRRVTSALRPSGLTHVQFVLLASLWWLASQEEVPRQRELAEHAGTDVMMTSQVLRALQQRGLVERRTDPGDARVKRVQVTPEGVRLAEEAIPAVEAVDRHHFGDVAEPDRLLAILQAMAGRDSRASAPIS